MSQGIRTVSGKWPLLLALSICGVLLAGCEDHVTVIRDNLVPVPNGATWAWKPAQPRKERADARPVISRDVIAPGAHETVVREPEANNEEVRGRVRSAIEQTLGSKGLRQVSDPENADFLVDYHLGVRRHNVTVERVYPGGYPGLVCGPFRCYESWGYGPPEVSFENIRFREGTFVLDIVQRASKRLAFRAINERRVKPDAFTQEQVNDAIRHMLKDLKSK
jgi:Domain of unknown function (DUF4136)